MYGTHTTLDLLRSNFQTLEEFTPAKLAEMLLPYFEAHNVRMQEFMLDIVEPTTDKERLFGTVDQVEMTKQSEFGRPDAQKITYGAVCGFPLHSFQATTQWTKKSLLSMSVSEVTTTFLSVRTADIQRFIREVQRAIYTPTNYNFNDYLMPRRSQVPLAVKALANADGAGLPPLPDGTLVDSSTHTHYLATNSFVAADLTALGNTVMEHYASGDLFYYINAAQVTAVTGFSGFIPYAYPGVVQSVNTDRVPGRSKPLVPFTNRPIGQFNGAEVWVKPWVFASYPVAHLRRDGVKTLAKRTRTSTSGDLTIVADDELYPLFAKTYEREFGIGVQERTSMAVLYTGGASYVAPTIAD